MKGADIFTSIASIKMNVQPTWTVVISLWPVTRLLPGDYIQIVTSKYKQFLFDCEISTMISLHDLRSHPTLWTTIYSCLDHSIWFYLYLVILPLISTQDSFISAPSSRSLWDAMPQTLFYLCKIGCPRTSAWSNRQPFCWITGWLLH